MGAVRDTHNERTRCSKIRLYLAASALRASYRENRTYIIQSASPDGNIFERGRGGGEKGQVRTAASTPREPTC